MKCCVIIPVGPGHLELAQRAAASVERAKAQGTGAFDDIEILIQDDSQGLGRSRARNLAVAAAGEKGADWLFFLDADDLMVESAFLEVADLLQEQDGIWGAIYVADLQSQQAQRRPQQISPLTTLEQLLLNDPYLTLQMGHFVRQEVAAAYPFDTEMDTGEDFDYYLRVWKENRCIKIDRPLFLNVRGQHSTGPRSATGTDWRNAINRVFSDFCRDNDVIASVPFGGQQVHFRLGNTLDLIQNQLAREHFFEVAELSETLLCLPKQARILDVGSNIGNHALFFACIGEAAEIHCFEPAEHIAEQLEVNFRINEIEPSRYGIHRLGIGASSGRASLDRIDTSNLGATSLKNDEHGQIEVETLDRLFPDADIDLLKIDVEGMELEVLAGAQALIQRARPLLLIEIANANKSPFLAWVAHNGYRVHRVFELVNASNYLLLPLQERKGFYERGVAAHREWKSRVPLVPGQAPCGWSIPDYLQAYLGDTPTLELRVADGRLLAHDLQRGLDIELGNDALADLSRRFPTANLVLGDILGRLNDEQFSAVLASLGGHRGDLLLLDIMDARWNLSHDQAGRYRDAEWYLGQANRHGFLLHDHQKLPHKAALGLHEQLDNRLTLLRLKKA
ncbi:hypothetical protein PKB_1647 [Pseudomonas knackmussii B13]|uniref:FkbM family methyltransferase n=1 Tax=Pseudomonas knackmussii (strain DSM 6978 / CCUG 54928 / LMG 23759 / B13) TaxID=1301098 RepID=A0A024HD73_PSEKB|nr:FkbM family methyltransferase [Pseudomonas knackmussii]CDF83005.1 hypothetical protein PKB_1647 [Pseudomonas knackmussii B13]